MTCFTAENSPIATVSYVIIFPFSHFIPVRKTCTNVRRDLDKASPGITLFYKIFLNYYGNAPVLPIKPQYIISTDDTVVYIFIVKGTKKDTFRLVYWKSLTHASHSEKYKIDNTNSMEGIRVKFALSFNTPGMAVLILITVVGLKESEISEEITLLVAVSGLFIGGGGGGGVNVDSKIISYVIFISKQEHCDLIQYTYYQPNILPCSSRY